MVTAGGGSSSPGDRSAGLTRGARAAGPRPRRDGARAVAGRAATARRRDRVPARQLPLPRRAGRRATSTTSASRPSHIRYLDRAAACPRRPHRYRFSSWNTVYRQLLDPSAPSAISSATRWPVRSGRGWSTVELADERSRPSTCSCAPTASVRPSARLLPEACAHLRGLRRVAGHGARGRPRRPMPPRLGDAITYYVYANSHILVYPIPAPTGR